MRSLMLASAVLAISIAGAAAGRTLQGLGSAPLPWSRCCGTTPWPVAPSAAAEEGWVRNLPRHAFILMSGIPAPYPSMSNPLPRSSGSIARGAALYVKHCASCHGATGAGDGTAGRALTPPPGDLAWLAQVPMVDWDPYMYWTVAEGGAHFQSAMPAYKDVLTRSDIWAVIGYIQARLPQVGR